MNYSVAVFVVFSVAGVAFGWSLLRSLSIQLFMYLQTTKIRSHAMRVVCVCERPHVANVVYVLRPFAYAKPHQIAVVAIAVEQRQWYSNQFNLLKQK